VIDQERPAIDDSDDDDDVEVPDETDEADDSREGRQNQSQFMSSTATTPGRFSMGSSDWRKIPLTRTVSIPSIHEHALDLSSQVGQNSPRARMNKRMREQMTQEEYEEACWQCNGVEMFQGGCKGGIIDFDLHPHMKVWRCDKNVDGEDCDFDMCEMCVRWMIHCERTGTDPQRLF